MQNQGSSSKLSPVRQRDDLDKLIKANELKEDSESKGQRLEFQGDKKQLIKRNQK